MGYKQTAKPEPTPRPPLYKPLSALSYDEFDDDIEITGSGRPTGVSRRSRAKSCPGLAKYELRYELRAAGGYLAVGNAAGDIGQEAAEGVTQAKSRRPEPVQSDA